MSNAHIEWAINILNNQEYHLDNTTPDLVLKTPWSTVYRFKTNHGFIFLKKVPPALSIEPKIINTLHKEFNANVPKILAVNSEACCFLMEDAGIQLHNYFKDNFQEDIFIKIMQDYTELQINTMDKIDFFLHMGVPNWRLEKIPKLYKHLISHDDLLINDGLNAEEIITLKKLEPQLYAICEKLSHYNIKDTFCHADFHDKNILIKSPTKKTTLIDLGEVVITHPFFSFLNCLHMAKENFILSESCYQELQLKCFKPWLQFETQENLFKILSLIQQCWSIHAVLGEFRLINSVDSLDYHKMLKERRLSKKLRYWITNNENGMK